jgi:hypothetical protein
MMDVPSDKQSQHESTYIRIKHRRWFGCHMWLLTMFNLSFRHDLKLTTSTAHRYAPSITRSNFYRLTFQGGLLGGLRFGFGWTNIVERCRFTKNG